MNWVLGIAVGTLAGMAAGWLAERAPVPALVQSVSAAFVGGIASGILLIWLSHRLRLKGTADVFFYGIGLENLALQAALCAIAAGLHVMIGYHASSQTVLAHRPMLLGSVVGLYAGVVHARVMDWLARFPPMSSH